MATSDSSSSSLPMAPLLHMITLKLSPSNYLYWKHQLLPLLASQKLVGHVDGSLPTPPATKSVDSKHVPNPDHTTWLENDQKTILIINSSLTEEAVVEILGLTSARQIWRSLEATYNNTSLERMHLLRDSLRQLSKSSSSVAEFGRKFKAICDQLAAIGQPVTETDKTHWFLCGLGPTFESWSTAIRTNRDPLSFCDLLTKAESQEQFLQTLHPPNPAPVTFVANQTHSRNTSMNRSSLPPPTEIQPQTLTIGLLANRLTANSVEPTDTMQAIVPNFPRLRLPLLVLKVLHRPSRLSAMLLRTTPIGQQTPVPLLT
ncbi:putative RNA-directed DNA polymerase [Helianthus annuus]|nr:putative RNA-directed DNA polymerase [Helianthus annuus]KAJ0653313.1 putative RNA-directed DNA polymerase [Helianthus annuus]